MSKTKLLLFYNIYTITISLLIVQIINTFINTNIIFGVVTTLICYMSTMIFVISIINKEKLN